MSATGRWLAWVIALAAALQACGHRPADNDTRSGVEAGSPQDSAEPSSKPQRDLYFGELHLHSSYSLDSYIFGNRNDPDHVYRFARGAGVTLSGGARLQLARPLDFVALTDHAETMGELDLCTTPSTAEYAGPVCSGIRGSDLSAFGRLASGLRAREPRRAVDLCGADGAKCIEAAKTTWLRIRQAADRYYEPGRFTTLVGFEFSPAIQGEGEGMLHRNVLFRNARVPESVFSAYDGSGEDLMRWLEIVCREPCQALTIPHNSNYSWGRFFWERNSDGTPWTREDLLRRARLEPLVEVFQIKGSSECQTGVGLADEECGFENVHRPCAAGQETNCATPGSFVRNALVNGLAVQRTWGVNPFKLGMIGATDNHNGTPGATAEDAYRGHLARLDATARQRVGAATATPAATAQASESPLLRFNPGGLAAVWADGNTREAIWDALARRETFATSGTRIRVRLFGGFDLPQDLHTRPDFAQQGYALGVAMGGDLPLAQNGTAPRFAVRAMRDPQGGPLQKLQIVKGWLDADGRPRDGVYDVACGDAGAPDPTTHRCAQRPPTVDLHTCRQTKDPGASQLATTWTDPDFDPREPALYYVRVLEIPSCRWSSYDARELGIATARSVPAIITERAWTSPIWYSPAP